MKNAGKSILIVLALAVFASIILDFFDCPPPQPENVTIDTRKLDERQDSILQTLLNSIDENAHNDN